MLLSSAVISSEASFDGELLDHQSESGQQTATAAVCANDNPRTLDERLQTSFAGAQREIANIAMYLTPEFRARTTKQLRVLLSVDNWDDDGAHLSLASARSFARAMALLRPESRPLLGLSISGNLLAMWKKDSDRLVIEHLPGDLARWTISSGEGADEDRAAGRAPIQKMPRIVGAHNLESLLYG